jgi:hypothetical protein
VFTLQTLPDCNEPFVDPMGKVAGFSLHAGVAARADERKKLERLCRYIARPAASEKRLSGRTPPILYEECAVPAVLKINVRDFALRHWKRY